MRVASILSDPRKRLLSAYTDARTMKIRPGELYICHLRQCSLLRDVESENLIRLRFVDELVAFLTSLGTRRSTADRVLASRSILRLLCLFAAKSTWLVVLVQSPAFSELGNRWWLPA